MTTPAPSSLWASKSGGAILRFVAPAQYLQPEASSLTEVYVLAFIGDPQHIAVDASDFHNHYQQVQ